MSLEDLRKKTAKLAERIRRLPDGELVQLYYEALTWRQNRLQALSQIDALAQQDVAREEVAEKEKKAKTIKEPKS